MSVGSAQGPEPRAGAALASLAPRVGFLKKAPVDRGGAVRLLLASAGQVSFAFCHETQWRILFFYCALCRFRTQTQGLPQRALKHRGFSGRLEGQRRGCRQRGGAEGEGSAGKAGEVVAEEGETRG